MGQIKNIKLHIVTDIKELEKISSSPRWRKNIQPILKIPQNRAKHVARISECISRTPVRQLKPSRRCTSGKPRGTSKMSWRKSKSFLPDDLLEELAERLNAKPTSALKEDGRSNQPSFCWDF